MVMGSASELLASLDSATVPAPSAIGCLVVADVGRAIGIGLPGLGDHDPRNGRSSWPESAD